MAKIYTRNGDSGETTLHTGPKIAKDQLRITVCGEIDELSTVLGVARSEGLSSRHEEIILRVQKELIELNAEVVCPAPVRCGVRSIGPEHVRKLETEIDEITVFLRPTKQFVIPGGNKPAALLQLARAVCRRAERRFVTLIRQEPSVSKTLLAYLNRLSDLLFVMARREEEK